MGLLDFFKKKGSPKDAEVKDNLETTASHISILQKTPQQEKAVKSDSSLPKPTVGHFDFSVPEAIGSAKKMYDRKVKLSYVNKSVADRAMQEKLWKLTLTLIDGRVHALSDGSDLGVLPKGDNSQEWIENGEPYKAIFELNDCENGYKARIALYRDKVKHYSDREQTVVGLTGYKSQKFQENGEWIPLDAELYARVDYDAYDKVIVFYDGQPIGFLPKRESKLFLDGNPVLTVFDHSDDDDDGKSQPFVRIYW